MRELLSTEAPVLLGPNRALGIAGIVSLAVCIGFGLAFVFSNVVSWDLEDMDAYWNAAVRLRDGLPLYPSVPDPGAADVFRYSPWFAWLWIPLTSLPKAAVQFGWSALLVSSIPIAIGPILRHRSAAAICLAALTGGLLVRTASTGNVHALLIGLLVWGAGRRSAPLWIAVAASLKFAPIAYALVYAGRREWGRAATTLLLTLALFAPALLLYDLSDYPTDARGSLSLLSIAGPAPFIVLAALAALAAFGLARTSYAWLAASVAVLALTPRLELYGLTYLLVGLTASPRGPRSQPQMGPTAASDTVVPSVPPAIRVSELLRRLPGRTSLASVRDAIGRASQAIRRASIAVLLVEALFIIVAGAGTDAHAYHSATLAAPYAHGIARTHDAYLYSPAFIQALTPLRLLPFEVFWILWVAMETGILVWLTGPVIAALVLVPVPFSPVFTELWYGNIVMPMALVLALGLRHPALWSFILLTKVTPGIGLLWFAARAEWRRLAVALVSTAAIVMISAAVAPDLWGDWIGVLVTNATGHPADSAVRLPGLPWRLLAAGAVIIVGARRNDPRFLPPAIILALPVFWFASLSLLLVWVWQLREASVSPTSSAGSPAGSGTFEPEMP